MKRWWIALAIVLIVATAARFHALGAKSLWLDEVLSWRLQSFPVVEMVQRSGEEASVHPPLYFLLLHFWVLALGDSEVALRSLAALVGVAVTLAMFFLVREAVQFSALGLARRDDDSAVSAGLLAALLVAVSPYHIYLAKQVRGYTLGMLLLVLSSLAILKVLGARSKKPATVWTAIYVLTALAFCYTHSLALFSIAAQAAFVVVYLWIAPYARKARKRREGSSQGEAAGEPPGLESASAGMSRLVKACSLAAGLAVFIGYSPWLLNSWGQSQGLRTSWTSTVSLSDLAQQPSAALAGVPDGYPLEPESLAWATTAALLAVLFVSGVYGGWAGIFLLLLGTIPMILDLTYCTFSMRSIFTARYLAFAQPAWLASFALVVSRIPYRLERAILATFLLSWLGLGLVEHWDVLGTARKPGMRDAAAYLAERGAGSSEPVLAQTPCVYFKLAYYLRAQIPVRLCVETSDRKVHFGAAYLQASDLIHVDQVLAQKPAGLWIVTSQSYSQYPYSDIPLPSTWRTTESKGFDQDIRWERPIEVKHLRAPEAQTKRQLLSPKSPPP